MKNVRITLFVAVSFILSSCFQNSNDFRNSFEELKELNELLIDNRIRLNGENDVVLALEKIEGAKRLLLKLKFNLNLCEIEYYNLDEANTFGIVYKFVCNSDKYYFMLYIDDPLSREEFISHEQLCDFGDEIEFFNERWTYRRINIFYE